MGRTAGGIEFEEIKPPVFKVGKDGITATRVLKIAWGDIDAFMKEVFPGGSVTSGGKISPNPLQYPGKPYLFIQDCDITPFDEEYPSTNDDFGVATCPSGAICTLSYSTTSFTPSNNQDNPTGADGEVILSKNLQIGGEYLTLPAKSLQWETGFGSGLDANQFEDLQAAKLIPTVEFVYTIHRYPELPLDVIVNTIGRVNANYERRFNAQPETLLYVGCNAHMNVTTEGDEAWEIEHRFIMRVIWVQELVPGEGITFVAKGWNHFLKPDSGNWFRLKVKGGDYIYNTADTFEPLFFPNIDDEYSSSQS